MSSCQKCEKPVYFAEQVESSGYLFHRACFRCSACRKLLTLGSHSQHKEDPYCNNCYSKHHGVKSYSKLKPIVYQPRNNSAEHKAETSEPRRNVEAEKHHSETEEHQSKDVMEEPEDNVEQEPKDDVAEHSDA